MFVEHLASKGRGRGGKGPRTDGVAKDDLLVHWRRMGKMGKWLLRWKKCWRVMGGCRGGIWPPQEKEGGRGRVRSLTLRQGVFHQCKKRPSYYKARNSLTPKNGSGRNWNTFRPCSLIFFPTSCLRVTLYFFVLPPFALCPLFCIISGVGSGRNLQWILIIAQKSHPPEGPHPRG